MPVRRPVWRRSSAGHRLHFIGYMAIDLRKNDNLIINYSPAGITAPNIG
jgi:hypothetical protein